MYISHDVTKTATTRRPPAAARTLPRPYGRRRRQRKRRRREASEKWRGFLGRLVRRVSFVPLVGKVEYNKMEDVGG